MQKQIRLLLKALSNRHRPSGRPDIFLFATPRGGSTWFTELIMSQPGFKSCTEPFNVRDIDVQKTLGISEFSSLFSPDANLNFEHYLKAIRHNRITIHNPLPLRKGYRPFTNRIVFKIIHAGMDRIAWFEKNFSPKILILLRHPIAVSLSRRQFPLLSDFKNCPLREQLTHEQLSFVDRTIKYGSHLEKGMVAWSLHNMFALQQRRSHWALVSYEEAITHPSEVIKYLSDKLLLPKPELLQNSIARPSRSTYKSSKERQALLADPHNRARLISTWRDKVTEDQESELMEIPPLFGIDAYEKGQDTIAEKYRIA